MNPKIRRAKGNKTAAPRHQKPLSSAGQSMPNGDTSQNLEEWVHIPLRPQREFENKYGALLDEYLNSEEHLFLKLAWQNKRIVEAYADAGVEGIVEEIRHADNCDLLFDCPGFKALPVRIQKAVRSFVAFEDAPRAHGPYLVLQCKATGKRHLGTPLVSWAAA